MLVLKVNLDKTMLEYDPAEDSWVDANDMLIIRPDKILVEVREAGDGCYQHNVITIEQLVKEAGYM